MILRRILTPSCLRSNTNGVGCWWSPTLPYTLKGESKACLRYFINVHHFSFTKNRKAWASSSCLATQPRPHVAPFSQKTVEGGMAGIVVERNKETYDMQCFPLYSLLMATGNRTVNYLSLDIEGAEFSVRKRAFYF